MGKRIEERHNFAYLCKRCWVVCKREQFNQRMSMFNFKCAYCGGLFEQIDHVKSISKNGPHCLSNLRPACQCCNNKKSNKDAKQWLLSVKAKI